jgi:hypothetical protein
VEGAKGVWSQRGEGKEAKQEPGEMTGCKGVLRKEVHDGRQGAFIDQTGWEGNT